MLTVLSLWKDTVEVSVVGCGYLFNDNHVIDKTLPIHLFVSHMLHATCST